jgi:hypothetical protein
MEPNDLLAAAAPLLPPPLFDRFMTDITLRMGLEPPGWRPPHEQWGVKVDGSGPACPGPWCGDWRSMHLDEIPRLTELWQTMHPGWPLPPPLRWRRYQLSRAPGFRLPPGVKSVAAPTRWQNEQRPSKRGPQANLSAVELYRLWLAEQMAADPTFLDPLRGCSGLACWCPLDLPCHAEALIEALIATTPWEPPA